MIKSIIIITLSFVLESNLSNFISINTNFFNTFLVFSSLIIIENILESKESLYMLAIITGLCYDLVFTDRVGYSIITFLLGFIIIKNINKIVKTKFNIIKYIIIIISYRLISYTILLLIGYLSFDALKLLHSIYSSILLNLIYIIMLKTIFLKNKS
ncbi:MAG: hypothetical protein HFI87_02310 [Bacilli bacterium]|nr:hypothetical protein [Bacilli bacterium]